MKEFLQSLLGDNWEIVTGGGGILLTIFGWGVSRYIKNKAVGDLLTKVSGFFTSDLSKDEQTEVVGLVKKFATRKQLKAINKLAEFLDTLDFEKTQIYVKALMTLLIGMTETMKTNGAFDYDPELKDKIESAINTIA